MSASSVRRVKERGGGSVKVTVAPAEKIGPLVGRSMSTGKENSRPTSRVRGATQKPQIRPMARIDKAAAAAEESHGDPRSRRSTSSVPRGRSSSPSEFNRVLSDLRKNPSRVSVGPTQKKVNGFNLNDQIGEKRNLGKNDVKDFEKSEGFREQLRRRFQDGKIENICGDEKKDQTLSSISAKKSDLDKKVFKELETNCKENEEIKIRVLNGSSEKTKGGSSSVSVQMESKVSTYVKDNSVNKYPSKLHEKLAFLEGKVKRIASDIKKTKDMLDMNNPDASKMILTDIQEKISGIEKAIGHVVDDRLGLDKTGENKEGENKVVDAKCLIKGLNVEELEARLFPHHKLIRDRTLSKATFGNSEKNVTEIGEYIHALNVDKKKVSSLNNNAIALEFLDSLSKEETKVGTEANSEIQEMDNLANSLKEHSSLNVLNGNGRGIDALLMADEKMNEFDEQDRAPDMILEEEELEDSFNNQLNDIGSKTCTSGWFVSEGESVLLAHDDGSCSFFDIANCEKKAEYKPPIDISPNMWRDCWIIRAPSADGCSGRYVVAASAGNSSQSGFCSWDFYTKEVRSFHLENETACHVRRTALVPLSTNTTYRRNSLSTCMASENRQWWYKPCGPLMISTATCQRTVQIFDIRDGDEVMKWELQKHVLSMDYSSPLQWRNKGKVVLAESDSISLWDVSSLSAQALMTVSGRKISALHVNNTDAELRGGVRQRISSLEAEGNDGVFCTPDFINVLDFRHPSGIGLKISTIGLSAQSAFSRGDSIYIGCTNLRSMGKTPSSSQIQHFSLRKQKLLTTYQLPETNAHHNFTDLTQVWGNSRHVMGVCGLGLFVFDSFKDDGPLSFSTDSDLNIQNVKEVIGPDDMYSPSFDYAASRVLLISRDRPALWRYLL